MLLHFRHFQHFRGFLHLLIRLQNSYRKIRLRPVLHCNIHRLNLRRQFDLPNQIFQGLD
jgi:hypothetical protein